jgi:hypothetical protein
MVDGVMVKGMTHIKESVVSHFASHFRASNVERPGLDNLQFRTLSLMEGGSLIKLFSLDEVKAVVWDCDSYKSPGSDDINIGFIKKNWLDRKDDIMQFIFEFHRNDKLTKCINNTFIALIQKVESLQKLNDFRPDSLARVCIKSLQSC